MAEEQVKDVPVNQEDAFAEDDFNISDFSVDDAAVEEAKEGEGFENAGKLQLSDDESYIEIECDHFTQAVKPFREKKTSCRDLVARCCLIETFEEFVELSSTDGTAYLWGRLPAKVNKFKEKVIVDLSAVYEVAKGSNRYTYLIEDNKKLYSDFFGGRVFIPTYTMKDDIFTPNELGKEVNSKVINVEQWQRAIDALEPTLKASSVPELSYIFMGPDGAFSSNGSIVTKVEGDFFKINLRSKDLPIIKMILTTVGKTICTLTEYEAFYQISSENFRYTFPKSESSLSDQYKESIQPIDGFFTLETHQVLNMLDILLHMPDDSGTIQLDFLSDEVKAYTNPRKGDRSHMTISQSKDGNPIEKQLQMSLKTFSVALSSFKDTQAVSIGLSADRMQLFSDMKKQSIIVN